MKNNSPLNTLPPLLLCSNHSLSPFFLEDTSISLNNMCASLFLDLSILFFYFYFFDFNDFVIAFPFFIFAVSFVPVLHVSFTSLATIWLNALNLGSVQQTEWSLEVRIPNAIFGQRRFTQKF